MSEGPSEDADQLGTDSGEWCRIYRGLRTTSKCTYPHVTLDNEAVERDERKFLSALPKAYTDKFEAHLQNVDDESYARNELPPASKPSKPKARPVHSSKGTGKMDPPSMDLDTGT